MTSSSSERRFTAVALRVALLLAMLTLSGCVALLPWHKPDAQARGDRPPTMCPIAGFTPGIPRPDDQAGVARLEKRRVSAQATAATKAQLRIRALMGQLNHEQAAVRTNAASDIGAYGKNAKVAVGVLADAVQHDESEWVRRAAVKSLAKIGTPDVIPPLRLALNDRNKWVAHSAVNALRKLGYRADGQGPVDGRGQLGLPKGGSVTAVPAVYKARGDTVNKFW